MAHIGEAGTEQFSVAARVNGKGVGTTAVHDPFIRTKVTLRGFRHAWNALTRGIVVEVDVNGSHGAEHAVMSLDPVVMDEAT